MESIFPGLGTGPGPDEDDEEDPQETPPSPGELLRQRRLRENPGSRYHRPLDDLKVGQVARRSLIPAGVGRGMPEGVALGGLRLMNTIADLFGLNPQERVDDFGGDADIVTDITDPTTNISGEELRSLDPATERVRAWKRLLKGSSIESAFIPALTGLAGGESSFTVRGARRAGQLSEPATGLESAIDNFISPLVGGLIPGIGTFKAGKAVTSALLKGPFRDVVRRQLSHSLARQSARRGTTVADDVIKMSVDDILKTGDNLDFATKRVATMDRATDIAADVIGDVASGSIFAGLYGIREQVELGEDFSVPWAYLLTGGILGGGIGTVSGVVRANRLFRQVGAAVDEGHMRFAGISDYVEANLPAKTVVGDKVYAGNGIWQLNNRTKTFTESPFKNGGGPDADIEQLGTAVIRSQEAALDAALDEAGLPALRSMGGNRDKIEGNLAKLEQHLKEKGASVEDVLAPEATLRASKQQKFQETVSKAQLEQPTTRSLADILSPEELSRPMTVRGTIHKLATMTDDLLRTSSAQPGWAADMWLYSGRSKFSVAAEINQWDWMARNLDDLSQRTEALAKADALKIFALESEKLNLTPEVLGAKRGEGGLGVHFPEPTLERVEIGAGAAIRDLTGGLDHLPDEVADLTFANRLKPYEMGLSDKNPAMKAQSQKIIQGAKDLRAGDKLLNLVVNPEALQRSAFAITADADRGLWQGAKVSVVVDELTGAREVGSLRSNPIGGGADIRLRDGTMLYQHPLKNVEILEAKAGDWILVPGEGGSRLPAKIIDVTSSDQLKYKIVQANPDGTLTEKAISMREIRFLSRNPEQMTGRGIDPFNISEARSRIQRMFSENLNEAAPEGLRWVKRDAERHHYRGREWLLSAESEDGNWLRLEDVGTGVEKVIGRESLPRKRADQIMASAITEKTADAPKPIETTPVDRPIRVTKDPETSGVVPFDGVTDNQLNFRARSLLKRFKAGDTTVTAELDQVMDEAFRRGLVSGDDALPDLTTWSNEDLVLSRDFLEKQIELKKLDPASFESEQLHAEARHINQELIGRTGSTTSQTGPRAVSSAPRITPTGPLRLDTYNRGQIQRPGHRLNYVQVPDATADIIRRGISRNDRKDVFEALTSVYGGRTKAIETVTEGELRAAMHMGMPRAAEGKTIFALEFPRAPKDRHIRPIGAREKFNQPGTVGAFRDATNFMKGGKIDDPKNLLREHISFTQEGFDRIAGIYEVADDISVANWGDILVKNTNFSDPAEVQLLREVYQKQNNGSLDLPPDHVDAIRAGEVLRTTEATQVEQLPVIKTGTSTVSQTRQLLDRLQNIILGEPVGRKTPDHIRSRRETIMLKQMKAASLWNAWPVERVLPDAQRIFAEDASITPLLRRLSSIFDQVDVPEVPIQKAGENLLIFNQRMTQWHTQLEQAMLPHKPQIVDATLEMMRAGGQTSALESAMPTNLPHRTVPGHGVRFHIEDAVTGVEAKNAARALRRQTQEARSKRPTHRRNSEGAVEPLRIFPVTGRGNIRSITGGITDGAELGITKTATVRPTKVRNFDGDGWYKIGKGTKSEPSRVMWISDAGPQKFTQEIKDAAFPELRGKPDSQGLKTAALQKWARGEGELRVYEFSNERPMPDEVVRSEAIFQDHVSQPNIIVEMYRPNARPTRMDLGAQKVIPPEAVNQLIKTSQAGREARETLYAISQGRKPPLEIYAAQLAAEKAGLPGPNLSELPFMRPRHQRVGGQVDITYNQLEASQVNGGRHIPYTRPTDEVLRAVRRDFAQRTQPEIAEQSLVRDPASFTPRDGDASALSENISRSELLSERLREARGLRDRQVGEGAQLDIDGPGGLGEAQSLGVLGEVDEASGAITGSSQIDLLYDHPMFKDIREHLYERNSRGKTLDDLQNDPELQVMLAELAGDLRPGAESSAKLQKIKETRLNRLLGRALKEAQERDDPRFAALLDELDPFLGRQNIDADARQLSAVFGDSPIHGSQEVPGRGTTRVLPTPRPGLRDQAYSLAKILFNFDTRAGRQVAFREFYHPDHPSMHGVIRKLQNDDYRVYIGDSSDQNRWVSREVQGGPRRFQDKKAAINYMEEMGLVSNENPYMRGDFEHLGTLKDPADMTPRELMEANKEIGVAIEAHHSQTGVVPQGLIDFANEFIDRGFRKHWRLDDPVLLLGEANQNRIGRHLPEELVDAVDQRPPRVPRSRTFEIIDGEVVHIGSPEELVRLSDPVYRSKYPSLRTMENLPEAVRMDMFVAQGIDRARQRRFLPFAHMDFEHRNVGNNPNFDITGSTTADWIHNGPALLGEGDAAIPGFIKRAAQGPNEHSAMFQYYDQDIQQWVTKIVDQNDISTNFRPGDMWDYRTVDGVADAAEAPPLHLTRAFGDSEFDRVHGLDANGPIEYPQQIDRAIDRILLKEGERGNQYSPFLAKDPETGNAIFRSFSDIDETELTHLTDAYLRTIEATGNAPTSGSIIKKFRTAATASGFGAPPTNVGGWHDGIIGLAKIRAKKLYNVGDDHLADLMTEVKFNEHSAEMEEALRGIGRNMYGAGADDVPSWAIMERAAREGLDRRTMQAVREDFIIPDNQWATWLGGVAGNERGSVPIGLYAQKVRGALGKMGQYLDPDTGRLPISFRRYRATKRRHLWGTTPRQMATYHPVNNYMYHGVQQSLLIHKKQGERISTLFKQHLMPYDPDRVAKKAFDEIRLRTGAKTFDEAMTVSVAADELPGGIASLVPDDLSYIAPNGQRNHMTFREFYDTIAGEHETARLDNIRNRVEMGIAPSASVTAENINSKGIRDIFVHSLKHDNPLAPRIVKGVEAGDEIRLLGFTADGARGKMRDPVETNFFMENLLGPGYQTADEFRLGDPANYKVVEDMGQAWQWMLDDLDFWQFWGREDVMPQVLRGRLQIQAVTPTGTKTFGFSESPVDATMAMREWTKQIRANPEAAAKDPFLRQLLEVLEARDAGDMTSKFDVVWESVRFDEEDIPTFGVQPMREFMRALESESAIDPTRLMALVDQASGRPALFGVEGAHLRQKRSVNTQRTYFSDPYMRDMMYLSKVNNDRHINRTMAVRRQAEEMDEALSRGYAVDPVWKPFKIDEPVGDDVPFEELTARFPQKAQKRQANMPGYANWIDNYFRVAIGDTGPTERAIDDWLAFAYLMEDNVRGGVRLAHDLTVGKFKGIDDAPIDIRQYFNNPLDWREHYRPFGTRERSRGMMAVQSAFRLGLSPAAAGVNASQWLFMSAVKLGPKHTAGAWGDFRLFQRHIHKVDDLVARHGPDWRAKLDGGHLKGDEVAESLPADWLDLHDLIEKTGVHIFVPKQQVRTGIGQATGRGDAPIPWIGQSKKDKALGMAQYYSMYLFNGAERMNRLVTAFGAARQAADQGIDGAELARNVSAFINDTQFDYAETGLPQFMQSSQARLIFQFQPFQLNAVKFQKDLLFQGLKGDKKAFAQLGAHFGLMGIVGGASALTLSPAIYGLLAAAKVAGLLESKDSKGNEVGGTSLEQDVENLLYRTVGTRFMDRGQARFDNPWWDWDKVMAHGVAGLFNMDVSRRIGVSGPELMSTSMGDWGAMVTGPHFSMYVDLWKGLADPKNASRIPSQATTVGRALTIGGAVFPTFGGLGGLAAAVGGAQIASDIHRRPGQERFIEPGQIFKNVTGVGRHGGRVPDTGSLFDTPGGRRFVRNVTPTFIDNVTRSLELAYLGYSTDLGLNRTGTGEVGSNASVRLGRKNVTRERISRVANRALGFASSSETINRWEIQAIREERRAVKENNMLIAETLAATILNDTDWSDLIIEMNLSQYPVDWTSLKNRLHNMSQDQREAEISAALNEVTTDFRRR